MYNLHLKCIFKNGAPQGLTLVDKGRRLWRTGHWVFTLPEAQKMIGGRLYLHETKAEPSHFGGIVRAVEQVELVDMARSSRIVFTIEFSPEFKGKKWAGADHSMAWTSGIFETDHD
jgi:hypothetical protein